MGWQNDIAQAIARLSCRMSDIDDVATDPLRKILLEYSAVVYLNPFD